jgi:hypothetical protein
MSYRGTSHLETSVFYASLPSKSLVLASSISSRTVRYSKRFAQTYTDNRTLSPARLTFDTTTQILMAAKDDYLYSTQQTRTTRFRMKATIAMAPRQSTAALFTVTECTLLLATLYFMNKVSRCNRRYSVAMTYHHDNWKMIHYRTDRLDKCGWHNLDNFLKKLTPLVPLV